MATSFSSLPVVDVSALKAPQLTPEDTNALSKQLYDVFATTGFAYLVNSPLTFNHDEIFGLAREFFSIPLDQKMRLAKKTFRPGHHNTYRGYFPTQPHLASDNLKEGFEIGNPAINHAVPPKCTKKINLSEANVWPESGLFEKRERLEEMYNELQAFASQLLSLLAVSLRKDADYFSSWLDGSLSTLRLLHYPPVPQVQAQQQETGPVKLSCTPHTDSGIITLLHQDSTGGLEVLNASGEWVPAPYIPSSIVVNIGDLMASVSGGRFTATMHRVRAPPPTCPPSGDSFGRFSIPFFFEPGEACVVSPLNGVGESVVYGEHVRKKMATWVEFQDDSGYDTGATEDM
ncbi:Clavaminate synthase-like protein [Lentithecium fluviatile CBS 122367]|uniref:Clavaminate synthase-like protein n=1 Tax=Lentithecium fluviatile CBS 122367 TaxID=1168545 RepID=A0A6G1J9H6_9PLEO|nr:Clavaminate synthase-like protein [Lentithecium fluviatile CBS 122367]